MTDTVDCMGATFRVADKVGLIPLLRFARVAKGMTSGMSDGESEMEGMAALFDLIEQCVDPDDLARFLAHTTEQRADFDDLQEFVGHVMALVAGRPTGRSSVSSGGPRIIEPDSTADSSSNQVVERLNQQGRPDLALLVRKRQESLTA